MTDVLLIRHGHVDYTPPTPITAHNALSPLGHQMAARLAERCATLGLQCLFASTMRRARETADAISARLPDLERLDMREFEETSIADMAGFAGAWPTEDLNTWRDEHFVHANARTGARVAAGWAQVQATIAARGLERVAIVSHGGAINALLRHFLGQDVDLRHSWFDLDYTSLTCLRYNGTGLRSVRWVNDARHVEDLLTQVQ
jgi:probable phosphoglycerate mutase